MCYITCGVHIVIDKSLKDRVVNIKQQGDKITLMNLLVENLVINVISAYVLQIIKRQFSKELDVLVSSMSISEKLFIRGELSGHVDSTRVGFDRVHEVFRYGSRN
jgi:hypothetical protein